jgi:hypothetical protein
MIASLHRYIGRAGAVALLATVGLAQPGLAQSKLLYENSFEKAEVNKVPDEFLVLNGAFSVKEEGGNKFLELPGAPLDDFGVLFGPTEKEGVAVSARVHSTGKGRRFPAFGVGLNGVGGYKLQVAASKKALELFKGEEVLTSVPYTWESGAWTMLRLQVRKVKDGQWRVEGKAWKQGAVEPAQWAIAHTEKTWPIAGRASITGNPISGTPIRFDDLRVQAVEDKP